MYKTYKFLIFSLFIGTFLLIGCAEDEDLGPAPRLFRPIVDCSVGSTQPFIKAVWTDLTSANAATSFTVELSTDTFATILKSVTTDTFVYVFDSLTWDLSYQVRVKCNGNGIESKYFTLVGVDLVYPTFLQAFTSAEIMDIAVRTRWSKNDSSYTSIKVFKESNDSLVKEVFLTETDTAKKYIDIYGLQPSTKYKVVAYANGNYQGYKYATTVASQNFPIKVDLRDIDSATASVILTTAYLQGLQSGSAVILKRGMKYILPSISLDRSLLFTTGLGFGNDIAVLDIQSGTFDIAAGASIDSIKFVNVDILGGASAYGAKYVFNVSTASSVNKILIDGCNIFGLRGVVRAKTTGASIDSLIFNNCIIDSINGYGFVNVDAADSYIKNIKVTNSTISDFQKLFVNTKSTNGTQSIYINNCTFCYAPLAGSYFFDYNNQTITNGITINNSIFGPGKGASATVIGYRGDVGLKLNNNFKTSDLTFSSNDIQFDAYLKKSTDLFVDPVNDNFTIKDLTFIGKSTAGDPRWRP